MAIVYIFKFFWKGNDKHLGNAILLSGINSSRSNSKQEVKLFFSTFSCMHSLVVVVVVVVYFKASEV